MIRRLMFCLQFSNQCLTFTWAVEVGYWCLAYCTWRGELPLVLPYLPCGGISLLISVRRREAPDHKVHWKLIIEWNLRGVDYLSPWFFNGKVFKGVFWVGFIELCISSKKFWTISIPTYMWTVVAWGAKPFCGFCVGISPMVTSTYATGVLGCHALNCVVPLSSAF